MRIAKFIGWGILAAAGGTLFLAGYTYVVMYLWNWLVPDIFHGPLVTFWQAAGMILLAKLFVGFSRGGWGGGRYKHYMWKERMKERFENMSPEQKEAFKQQMKDRWGRGRWGRNCGPFEDAKEAKSEVKPEEQA